MTASILLTYRAGESPERRDNLFAVLAWLAATPQYEVVVVEQDRLPTLTAPLPHPNSRMLFAYNPGPFNKSWGYNVAARLATQPVLGFCDADVIVPGMLEPAVAHCASQYTLVKPYRRIVDLTPQQSARLRAGGSAELPPGAGSDGREQQGEYVVLCGGLFLIRATALHQLGGWDERFRGWGGEDDAFTYAVQRARLPTLLLDQEPALHLWHPRSTAATSARPHYRDNCALLERLRGYSNEELGRFAEVNRQAMGNPRKYSPHEAAL